MMNLRGVLLSLGLLGVFGTGCIVEVTASRGAYERCSAGDSCLGGTTCTQAAFVVSGTGSTNVCTAGCSNAAQCPVGGNNSTLAPTCVISASAGVGQCYDTCNSDADCGFGSGTRCSNIAGTLVNICAPIGSGTSCGGSGQACCAGNLCSGGLACVGGTCATAPPPCGASGQACCTGNMCGTGLACVNNVCAAATPARPFYAKCVAGDACSTGTTCIQSSVQVAGMAQGSHCSTLCPTGAANTCPGYVAGQVECIAIGGNVAQAQCFRLCQSTNDCTMFNTTCTQIMMPAGPIRVCAPTG
jgi:hypothetical protein